MVHRRKNCPRLRQLRTEACQFSENDVVALRRACFTRTVCSNLTAESVQSASLALQGVHNVHGRDSLPLGVLSVGDSIADDVLKEHLQHAPRLLVDESRNTFDTTTTGQTTNSRLGDTLDVITQHLPVALCAPLSESLASFAASRHTCC